MSSGTEPLSGELGNTSAGEPYDAGNMSGIPPQQSNLSTPHTDTSTTNTSTTDTLHHDGSTATSASPSNAARNAPSSAGHDDHEATFSSAGGVQGSKSGSDSAAASNVVTGNSGNTGTGNTSGTVGDDPEASGPPAQKISFTKKEIDEAANVYKSHENPHTIGPDGKEETLEEAGGYQKEINEEGQEGAHTHKKGMGAKIEAVKEKVLHKHQH